jgi:CheY-like chemotaxis protein
MDISMPVMDGYAATKAIRDFEQELNLRMDERCYIIGLTGHCSEVYKD